MPHYFSPTVGWLHHHEATMRTPTFHWASLDTFARGKGRIPREHQTRAEARAPPQLTLTLLNDNLYQAGVQTPLPHPWEKKHVSYDLPREGTVVFLFNKPLLAEVRINLKDSFFFNCLLLLRKVERQNISFCWFTSPNSCHSQQGLDRGKARNQHWTRTWVTGTEVQMLSPSAQAIRQAMHSL